MSDNEKLVLGNPESEKFKKLTFRPVETGDDSLLQEIYIESRAEEMAMVAHWSEEQKLAFLLQQFHAQDTYYHQLYTNATFDIILLEGHPVGRLYIDRTSEEILIIDIALLPSFRNLGFGEYILRELMVEASETGRRVSLHVERFNKALHLYTRLGFTIVDELQPIYLQLEWNSQMTDINRFQNG